MRLGKKIRVMRERLDLSQEELARKLGVTTKTVYRWEALLAEPSKAAKARLASFLCQQATMALPKPIWIRFVHLRNSANRAVGIEVHKGRIPRLHNPKMGLDRGVKVTCVDCGKNPAIEYDHRDYTRPLEVDPVCQSCNQLRGMAIDTLEHIWN